MRRSNASPGHILIIPDGNRRWARLHSKNTAEGHEQGAKTFEKVLSTALKMEIPYLTCWALSKDNIAKRPSEEISFLFQLLERLFMELAASDEVHDNKVRIRFLGRWNEYCPPEMQSAINWCMKQTASYHDFNLTLLVAYSGLDEMKNAFLRTVMRLRACYGVDLQQRLDGNAIKSCLWTHDLPPVDLVIRTGGEPHLSDGVMMWDIANAYLYFTKTFWPAFSAEEFRKAINDFRKTERRLGQ